MKKQYLFEYRLFSAIFYTQQRKDNVIGSYSDVIMDLTFTALERFCDIVLSGQVWW